MSEYSLTLNLHIVKIKFSSFLFSKLPIDYTYFPYKPEDKVAAG